MPFLRVSTWIALATAGVPIPQTQALLADSFEARHARDLAQNPSDLHFQLDTVGSQRAFHLGERIPLTLKFSSDSRDKYKLNGATYDRSGRLPTEEFVMEQDGVADPYRDYFGTSALGGPAGGIRGYPILEPKAYEIEVDLNDWYRFDRAGHYRLYLKSHRLTREALPGESDRRTVEFAAVSNILEIEILAEDPAWEAAKLSEIRAALELPEREIPKPGGPPIPYDPLTDEKIRTAHRELRYLATPGAVQLAFEHARKNGTAPDALLLVGARNRALTVAAFDSYLADPAVGIREWDVRVRAFFTLLDKDASRPVPVFFWQNPEAAEMEKVTAMEEAQQKRFEGLLQEEAIRLIPIAAGKNAAARKTSAEAIAAIAPKAARAAGLVPPDDYGLSRQDLIAAFVRFSQEQQSEFLTKKWDLVRGPEMIPALKNLIATAKPQPLPDNALALQVWGSEEDVGETALRRLMELAPQEAARILDALEIHDNSLRLSIVGQILKGRALFDVDLVSEADHSGYAEMLARQDIEH